MGDKLGGSVCVLHMLKVPSERGGPLCALHMLKFPLELGNLYVCCICYKIHRNLMGVEGGGGCALHMLKVPSEMEAEHTTALEQL